MESELSDYKEKYESYRHHAWAGLGLLTVFIALNYFLSFPFEAALFVVIVLSIYITVALIFTYRYSKGLKNQPTQVQPNAKLEKDESKAEKKRIKAELKAEKKTEK